MQLALEFGIEPKNMAKGAAAGVEYLKKTTDISKDSDMPKILAELWHNSSGVFKTRLIERVKKAYN
jgi:hypothetical protein